jgi:predicted AAA+ superfamily ATPase
MTKITYYPFGQADCESELKILKSGYEKLYFDETPFNDTAIEPDAYLIIGRRGSGKTALSQYFSFQKVIKNHIYIDVDEPDIYQHVLIDISNHASEFREIAIPRLKKLPDYL